MEDSLQTRRGLAVASANDKPSPRTIAPDKLAQIAHTPRDYTALLKAIPGARAAVMSPLASVIPSDALVLEFSSAADLAGLPSEFEGRFGMLLHAAESTPSADDLLGKYRTQLALELDGLAKTFGHLAFRHAAVVLSDPYLREGTDVSVLFETESQDVLREVLAKHLASTAARVGAVKTSTVTLEGVPCTLHESANRDVRRYEVSLGSHVLALTNSAGAAARLLRAASGKSAKLSESADYKYARTLSPHDAQAERMFAFFGDAAVERINSGAARIVEARRSRAESELASVNYAALLHGWMTGKAPATTAEMLKTAWLLPSDLKHSDGKTISWSPELGAESAWGRVGHIMPLVDVVPGKFGKDEVSVYADFARDYDGITNGRLDPTSFRVARAAKPGVWDTELRVLPLSLGGEFRRSSTGLLENGFLRGGTFGPGATSSPLSFAMALGGVGEARGLASLFLGSEANDALQVVGDWGAVGADDGAVIWESALEHGEVLSHLEREARPHFNLDTDIDRIPGWAMMHLKSRIAFKALASTLKAKLETKRAEGGRDEVRWESAAPYKGEDVQQITLVDGDVHASLYYATSKDVLVAALRRDVLEARIDDVLAGRAPVSGKATSVKVPGDRASHTLDFAPPIQSSLRRALYALLDRQSLGGHARACASVEILARGLGAQYTGDAAARRALALRTLGYAPASPQGGDVTSDNGQCLHGVLGRSDRPNWPDARDATPLHSVLDGILGVHIETSFVPRGAELELVVRTRLNAAP